MNTVRLTRRGYLILGSLATLVYLSLLGILGWIEGLS